MIDDEAIKQIVVETVDGALVSVPINSPPPGGAGHTPPGMMTVREASAETGLNAWQIRRLMRDGHLNEYRSGYWTYIQKESLDKFKREQAGEITVTTPTGDESRLVYDLEYKTTNDAVKIFKVQKATVLKWINQQRFPHAYKETPYLRSSFRIPNVDIQAFSKLRNANA